MNFAVQTRARGKDWGILNYVMVEDYRTPGASAEDAREKAREAAQKKMMAWQQSAIFSGDQEFRVDEGQFDNCKPEQSKIVQ